MQDTYIRGHYSSHSYIVGASLVNATVTNFEFSVEKNNIRDLLIENIGTNDVYMVFDKAMVTAISIPDVSTKKDTFIEDGTKYGWLLKPDRPLSLEHCDFTNIGLVCKAGKTSSVQILAVLDH